MVGYIDYKVRFMAVGLDLNTGPDLNRQQEWRKRGGREGIGHTCRCRSERSRRPWAHTSTQRWGGGGGGSGSKMGWRRQVRVKDGVARQRVKVEDVVAYRRVELPRTLLKP